MAFFGRFAAGMEPRGKKKLLGDQLTRFMLVACDSRNARTM